MSASQSFWKNTENLKTLGYFKRYKSLASMLGVNYNTFMGWRHECICPPVDVLVDISDLFRIPIDLLVREGGINERSARIASVFYGAVCSVSMKGMNVSSSDV